jgi:hypothetical protein
MKDITNVLQVIGPADVCSIQIWMLRAIDEYVPNDACLDSSDDDIPGMEILLIELKKKKTPMTADLGTTFAFIIDTTFLSS